MISYWKTFRNLSNLLRNLTYLSLLNSFLLLSRFSASLKSLDNCFFRWFAYKSLLSRFIIYGLLIIFPYPAVSHVFQGLGSSGSASRVQGPGPGFRSSHWLVSKGMCDLLFDVFNGCSLVKKYICKGISNIYYWEKRTFSKLVGKVNFSERKSEKMQWLWRVKWYKVY